MYVDQRIGPLGSSIARGRLLADQRLRPIMEQRAALTLLARRLETACRGQLLASLPARARADRRLMPMLGDLARLALDA